MKTAIRYYSKFGHTRKMAAIMESNYPKVKALFERQGIKVDERQFTCRGSMGPIQAGHPNKADHEALAAFIEKLKIEN